MSLCTTIRQCMDRQLHGHGTLCHRRSFVTSISSVTPAFVDAESAAAISCSIARHSASVPLGRSAAILEQTPGCEWWGGSQAHVSDGWNCEKKSRIASRRYRFLGIPRSHGVCRCRRGCCTSRAGASCHRALIARSITRLERELRRALPVPRPFPPLCGRCGASTANPEKPAEKPTAAPAEAPAPAAETPAPAAAPAPAPAEPEAAPAPAE